mmetsp:Transcript_40142/g.119142  ORF Transcript_40142/g.119142 Transcript_40142/m.119142 type:complete len:341 (-) Transcript_40142:12-1034(-)
MKSIEDMSDVAGMSLGGTASSPPPPLASPPASASADASTADSASSSVAPIGLRAVASSTPSAERRWCASAAKRRKLRSAGSSVCEGAVKTCAASSLGAPPPALASSLRCSTALTVKTGSLKGASCHASGGGRAPSEARGMFCVKDLVSSRLVKALRASAHCSGGASSSRRRFSTSSLRLKMSACEATKASSPIDPRCSSSRRSGSGIRSLADLSLHARRMLDVISTVCADAMMERIDRARAWFSSCVPGTSYSRSPALRSEKGANSVARCTSGHNAPPSASSEESTYGWTRRANSASVDAERRTRLPRPLSAARSIREATRASVAPGAASASAVMEAEAP